MGADAAGLDPAVRLSVLRAVEAALSERTGALPASIGDALTQPGLVWGLEFAGGSAQAVQDLAPLGAGSASAGFRWLHFNLTDRWTHRWIGESAQLPRAIRELLLSQDAHQRALIDGDYVGCVLQDFEREFDDASPARVGVLHVALGPSLLLTARHHPLRCADIARRRIGHGAKPADAIAAFDLLTTAMAEGLSAELHELTGVIHNAEDALLEDGRSPDRRMLITVRRRAVQLHRLLFGSRAVFHRLEDDEALPANLLPSIARFAQRLAAFDNDVSALQSQLRTLREELDLQAAQRTNQNLYVLSILSALLMPATLVTGIFGMNTGGLPWASAPLGTLIACLLAVGSAGAVYLVLHLLGFVRR